MDEEGIKTAITVVIMMIPIVYLGFTVADLYLF
jgi:hypothetical protein